MHSEIVFTTPLQGCSVIIDMKNQRFLHLNYVLEEGEERGRIDNKRTYQVICQYLLEHALDRDEAVIISPQHNATVSYDYHAK